jgi:hypothetical protein
MQECPHCHRRFGLTPAQHEAEVRAVMEERIARWLEHKGLGPSQKQCRRCHQWYDVALFHRNRTSPDGLQPHCMACVRVCSAIYQARRKARLELVGGRQIA